MKTVKQVSKQTGVSIRALQYYDKIGLLKATEYTDAGYRLYDNTALERLQQILLLRELEFPLKDIKKILSNPDFDKTKAIENQIELLLLKKEHIEKLIEFAREIKRTGGYSMDFNAFDKSKIEEYSRQAKEKWGATQEYAEFEKKNKDKTYDEIKQQGSEIMAICAEFGRLKNLPVDDLQVISQVRKLQDFISENYYTCTDEILYGLGMMYGAGGELTENINAAGGPGAAEYACKAIVTYCSNR